MTQNSDAKLEKKLDLVVSKMTKGIDETKHLKIRKIVHWKIVLILSETFI